MISIITPSYNRADMIGDAIRSVLEQGYPLFEHIIIDGASTDGTLDTLRQFPHLCVVSEPDNGMYDAINKGIRMAKGEIICLLNTDDVYAPGAFETVAQAFAEHPETIAVVGSAITIDEKGALLPNAMPRPTIQPKELWHRVVLGTPVTNAWFFKREVFEKVGYFDTSYHYASDREFLMRAVLLGVRPQPIEKNLYCYRSHAGSATINQLDSRIPERGAQRIKMVLEAIRIYEEYLHKKGIPPEMHKYALKAHDINCYKLCITALYHRQFQQAFRAAFRGSSHNLFWPLIFLVLLAKRIQKEIGFNA